MYTFCMMHDVGTFDVYHKSNSDSGQWWKSSGGKG